MKPTSRSFNRLLKAKDAQEIADAVNTCCWEADGNDGEPPQLTADDLKPHEPVQVTHDLAGGLNLEDIREVPIPLVRQQFGIKRGQIYPTPELDKALDDITAEFDNLGDLTVGEVEKQHPGLWEKSNMLFTLHGFFTFGVFLIEDLGKRIEELHSHWLMAQRYDVNMPHPLAPIVKAWLVEQTAKPITREYDRTHPGAILPQKSVASARYPLVETAGEAIAPAIEPPNVGQLLLPTLERKIYLPEYLPIQIVQGVDMTGRNGVLPYPMRFFFEVGMSLKPKQRKGWYTKTLYDAAVDIGVVDPNSDKERKKYLRTDAKQAIANALEVLRVFHVHFDSGVGGIGAWYPFYAQSTPTATSEKDFPIRVGVELPPDDARGVLVVKEIVRSLYAHLAQLNAYLAACVIFNQYGISPQGNLIDPTEPDPDTPRLESGQYVDPTTRKPMFTVRGKPITDLYHSDAFETLKPFRVFRKEADNYPTLDTEEIMRAVFPKEPWKTDRQPKRWEKKARVAWKAIADKGYIRIVEKRNGNLQILPSDDHVRLHHEVMKSSKSQN